MVARLFRLRVALLGGAFRGSFGHGLRMALGLLLLAAGAAALALAPLWLIPDPGRRAIADTVIGGIVLALVLVVPFFENRRMLEPRQFGQFPARPGSIAAALLTTTVVSWSFLLLLVWLVALGALRPEWPLWAALAGLCLAAILAVCSVRVVSAVSRLLAGARYAGAIRTVGALLAIALLPVAVFAAATAFGPSGEARIAEASRVMAWTPFGAPFAGISAAASGDAAGAALRFGVALAAILVLIALWWVLVRVSLQRVDRPADPAVARRGLGWFERFSARPAQVIAARELTYWARDPRYRVAFFAIPVAPILMMAALWVAGMDLRTLALIPLPVILLLFGWSQHNDIAMDSTAIWEHVASGTRGRADRAGRMVPVLMVGLPIALIGSSITVTLLGDWRVLPAVLGLNVGVLLVACAVSSVFSALMPYPTTRPGDSPFVQPQWSGSGSGLAQTLSMLAAIALAVPVLWVSGGAIADVDFAANLWALLFGAGYGLVVLLLGVWIGGYLFDRSAPELIAVTQVFD